MLISGTILLSAFVAVVGLIGGVFGFVANAFLKIFSDKLQDQTNVMSSLSTNFTELKNSLETFVKKQDHKEDVAELKSRISKAEDKLELFEINCVRNHPIKQIPIEVIK
jgi:hypothetical protein